MLITQTPLRISVAGGGTDFPRYYQQHGGAVVSTAIDKYVYVVLNSRFDSKIYVSYSKIEIVDSVDDVQHELVREAMIKTGVTQGIELHFLADVPSAGCGLGSSSTFTVGLLNALYTYRGIQAPSNQLAEEACDIEINRCGKPIGKQDQYIAAYGGFRYIEFLRNGSITVEEIPIREHKWQMDSTLLLFFTNVTRKADDILQDQVKRTNDNVAHLREIRGLADRARNALAHGRHGDLGPILARNWDIKKELAGGITNPEIDKMVALAQGGGATGCKICGAGGGGFLLTCCPNESVTALRAALSDYREMPFFFERCGSKVIFNVESYEWK